MNKTTSKLGLCVLIAGFSLILLWFGGRWVKNSMHKREVAQALRETDILTRLNAMKQLLDDDKPATIAALLSLFEGNEHKLRVAAAKELITFRVNQDPAVIKALINHLKTDNDARIRLCCVIGLAETKTPEVTQAYIQASADPDEKVASWACLNLEDRSGKEVENALFQRLSAPSWDVRLSACKSLIKRKTADERVVATLEKMAEEPEAKEYDAQIAEFDRIEQETRAKYPNEPQESLKMWGKLGEITAQARQIAAKNH